MTFKPNYNYFYFLFLCLGKCEDKHDKETCDFLKGKGYCKRFSQSMHKICSSTCGICKKPAHN
uniref:Toxin candidate TRINITY_DN21784_c8_g1_i2 n=1 Tax=Ceriantheomorphe brasiliensis TaxID=1048506 RepID=A0A7G7WZ32_9CNID|nr:toxin candidate TRINITY_DN21784_c8_g1_i2 [Ceriantheomorphe brasiliensis]